MFLVMPCPSELFLTLVLPSLIAREQLLPQNLPFKLRIQPRHRSLIHLRRPGRRPELHKGRADDMVPRHTGIYQIDSLDPGTIGPISSSA